MAFGSWFWGFVANTFRVETAFIASGVAMLASLLLVFVFPLSNDEAPDITPARTHPVEDLKGPVGATDGRIAAKIESPVRQRGRESCWEIVGPYVMLEGVPVC